MQSLIQNDVTISSLRIRETFFFFLLRSNDDAKTLHLSISLINSQRNEKPYRAYVKEKQQQNSKDKQSLMKELHHRTHNDDVVHQLRNQTVQNRADMCVYIYIYTCTPV